MLRVSTNNEYNDPGRDSNEPASAPPIVWLLLSPLSHPLTPAQARISGGGSGQCGVATSHPSNNHLKD